MISDLFDRLFGDETWGLHDAQLASFRLDWSTQSLKLDARLRTTERADRDRLARLRFTGVAWYFIESGGPFLAPRRGGFRIDGGDGAPNNASAKAPPLPEGCSEAWLFVEEWNGFVRFAARSVTFEWLEPADAPLA